MSLSPQQFPDRIPAATDEELVGRTAGGDRDAFAALYDRLVPSVHGLARRVVIDPTLAEDVTQDVLLIMWIKAGAFDPARGSVRAWVMTIAHRRAVDEVRRQQAHKNTFERWTSRPTGRPFDEVEAAVFERLDASAASSTVTPALDSLTLKQRTAIELTYFDGLTCAQVAEVLQVPLGTAKTRIHDGLCRLATQLGPATSGG